MSAEPFSDDQLTYWRGEIAERHVDPETPWRDADAMATIARFVATLDVARSERDALAAVAEAARTVVEVAALADDEPTTYPQLDAALAAYDRTVAKP